MSTNNIQPEFGVIGLGRMAQALVAPLLAKGHVDPQQLLAVVGSAASAALRRAELPQGVHVVAAADSLAVNVWRAPMQLLAVKPQQLDAVAQTSAPVQGRPLLIPFNFMYLH